MTMLIILVDFVETTMVFQSTMSSFITVDMVIHFMHYLISSGIYCTFCL